MANSESNDAADNLREFPAYPYRILTADNRHVLVNRQTACRPCLNGIARHFNRLACPENETVPDRTPVDIVPPTVPNFPLPRQQTGEVANDPATPFQRGVGDPIQQEPAALPDPLPERLTRAARLLDDVRPTRRRGGTRPGINRNDDLHDQLVAVHGVHEQVNDIFERMSLERRQFVRNTKRLMVSLARILVHARPLFGQVRDDVTMDDLILRARNEHRRMNDMVGRQDDTQELPPMPERRRDW